MISIGWEINAGLICVSVGGWALHLGVDPEHWTWGRELDWYDGPISSWGLGPIALLTHAEKLIESLQSFQPTPGCENENDRQ